MRCEINAVEQLEATTMNESPLAAIFENRKSNDAEIHHLLVSDNA